MTDTEFNRLMHEHLALVERLGAEHPETERAMRRALEVAPHEIQWISCAIADGTGDPHRS
jgi:hypothetical protein